MYNIKTNQHILFNCINKTLIHNKLKIPLPDFSEQTKKINNFF